MLGALAQAHIRLFKTGKLAGGEIYGTA